MIVANDHRKIIYQSYWFRFVLVLSLVMAIDHRVLDEADYPV